MELCPAYPTLQNFVLYETKAKYFLVGTDAADRCFRILKIDRTEPFELNITEDKTIYEKSEMTELLNRIYDGHQASKSLRMSKKVSAYGILGFVRFFEGYYIVLITERKRIAYIGSHAVYKIEDTTILPIPCSSVRVSHSDESRYLKIFQNVDLSSNFYFSYTYDLTSTLQYNMHVNATFTASDADSAVNRKARSLARTRLGNCSKYVWNNYLMKPARKAIPEWIIPVIHGYIQQAYVPVYSCPLYLTVIARRSRLYAGTRFLKRGSNDQGNVANEVETEVIASVAFSLTLTSGHFTSYVTLRGSVPLPWSQDYNGMVPKPQIRIDRPDPFGSLAAQHFCELFERYGSPIMVFNLAKKNERRPRESILSTELKPVIEYLNQFLAPEHKIEYTAWDMARFRKTHQSRVIDKLEEMAEGIVRKTGFFHNGRELYCNQMSKDKSGNKMGRDKYSDSKSWRFQTGISRLNCVDCIDRTNTAQFMIHRQALGYQLRSLGIIGDHQLPFESDIMRLFEGIFEAHGDTIALQYGGSQLVHSIRTYRKASPWALQSRDILNSVSRYYSNAFTDFDKQMGINVFLGVFQPKAGRPHLWELPTDYYLHHKLVTGVSESTNLPSYTCWFGDSSTRCLPFPFPPKVKKRMDKKELRFAKNLQLVERSSSSSGLFEEFYEPTKMTFFEKEFYMDDMNSTRKNYMPADATDVSPFATRARHHPEKHVSDAAARKTVAAHPSLITDDNTSESEGGGSSDDCGDKDDVRSHAKNPKLSLPTDERKSSLTEDYSMKTYYGVEIRNPSHADVDLYRRFSQIGTLADKKTSEKVAMNTIHQQLANFTPSQYFSADSLYRVIMPEVSRRSVAAYRYAVNVAQDGPKEPVQNDKRQYARTELHLRKSQS